MAPPPSRLAAALRLLARGLPGRPRASPAVGSTPARRVAVERTGIIAAPEQVRRYLSATRSDAAALNEGVLPPTYSAVWETTLLLELLGREEIPFASGGVIHVRSELVVLRPLRLGEAIRCRVEVEGLEETGRGTRLRVRCRSWSGAGQLCQENATELLLRTRSDTERGGERSAAPAAPDADGDLRWTEVAEWTLDGLAGLRYARASGDFNPIHLWSWSARPFGYRRPILHGHCSMAMIAAELVRSRPAPLRRLDASLRSPLFLPARVRLQVAGNRYRLIDRSAEGRRYVEGGWVA